MSKRFTKIICAMTASTFILGAVAVAGCSNYYNSKPLAGDYSGAVSSNGGFAVEKGNYVYYINGVESGTALNDYGKPVKGAIYRVSKSDLANKNYSSVQKVVPSIAYSSNYNAGIFIYGDRIYYGTPSTAKNSEGVVQNSYLDMKSSKLDGTETLKEAYVSFPSASYEYRFVEEGNTVYLLYVATDEKLYEESTGVKNLHSYNTATGKDTLLAYNVGDVTFDSGDKTNSRVYYTMSVYNYTGSSNSAYDYNQLYTVKADATVDKFAGKLNSQTVLGWNDADDEDKGIKADRYINCGDLVLDGIMGLNSKTPFNYQSGDEVNNSSYTYTVRQYAGGTVYYTRTTTENSTAYLFALADKAEDEEYAPITNNLEDGKAILNDGSNAGNYRFVTVDDTPAVLCAESSNGITLNKLVDGKLGNEVDDRKPGEGETNTYYPVVKEDSATILHIDEDNDYLYYSTSDSSGYTINRINYAGTPQQYNDASNLVEGNDDYKPVKILDLKASSSWYMPEFISDYIFFASMTTNMTNYNYIMVFDLHKDGSALMTNADLSDLNDKYEGIEKTINEVYGNTDKYPEKSYKNITNALKYAYYNGDYDYLKEYAEELNGALKEGEDLVYSEQTFAEYENFLKAEGDIWGEYKEDTKTVNGKTVYANNHDYYYSLLGEMSEADAKAYGEGLKVSYLVAKPAKESEPTWYEGLSTVEKVFFIIGMCLIGALVIGGGAWLTVYLVRRNKKHPEERRRRIKVDTTDDRSVDVYADNE